MIRAKLVTGTMQAAQANFYARSKRAQQTAREVVEKYAELTRRKVSQTCAYDTGYMSEHVEARLSAARLAFEVGWYYDTFMADNPPGNVFYPPYPELGTESQPPQPSLKPAYAYYRPYFERDLAQAIRRTTERR